VNPLYQRAVALRITLLKSNVKTQSTLSLPAGGDDSLAALNVGRDRLFEVDVFPRSDYRLQMGGVLRSWAVPRGPSMDPSVRRLAVQVDDHTLEAGEFEGVHEGSRRGSGAVIIWDEGTVEVRRDEPDHVSFVLDGHKLQGRFGLTRTGGNQWILVKAVDAVDGTVTWKCPLVSATLLVTSNQLRSGWGKEL